MKNSLIFIILTFLSVTSSFGQNIHFGLRLGLTNSLLNESYNGQKGATGAVNNVDVAGYLDVDRGSITIEPGLAFYLKGGTGGTIISSTSTSYQLSNSMLKLYYAEVPVNVTYNFVIKGGRFFIGAGPYLAVALSGSNSVYSTTINGNGGSATQNTETDVKFGGGQDELNRIDYGINTLGGFRFRNGIELGLAYGIGLANISNTPNLTAKNITGSITLGYFFK